MHPQFHLIDETWIAAPPATLAAVVADAAHWPGWWPGLELTVTRNRGVKGMQWTAVPRAGAEPLAGSVEIWLEPFSDGVILHHFLRLDRIGTPALGRRRVARLERRLAWQAKRVFWQLKDDAEAATEAASQAAARTEAMGSGTG